jgi:uncharacterized protein
MTTHVNASKAACNGGRQSSAFFDFIRSDAFPCVGARAAAALGKLRTLTVGRIGDASHDAAIWAALRELQREIDRSPHGLHSLAVIFREEMKLGETEFEDALWRRLQALHDIDVKRGVRWASDVSCDPHAADFAMSVAGSAWFVVGLHPNASRPARRFSAPALIFNSHEQFERLRADGRYARMQAIIRERELSQTGCLNPMLSDFGAGPASAQYSGRAVDGAWRCPLSVHQP